MAVEAQDKQDLSTFVWPTQKEWRHPQVALFSIATACSLLAAEGEVQTGEVLEVVLAGRRVCNVVGAEVGVHVVHLDGPQLDVRRKSVVEASAVLHREPVVASAARATSLVHFADVTVEISVRSAKQRLSERLELARVLLDLGAKHVGEKVAGRSSHDLPVLTDLLPAALGIAHEVSLDADPRSYVVNESTAATENVEASDASGLGVNVDKGKAHRNFELRHILREGSHGEQ